MIILLVLFIILLANLDFPPILSNILSFSSGDNVGTIRCFTVRIYDDTRVENDEFFTVSLTNGVRTQATGSSTRINILDNDGKS